MRRKSHRQQKNTCSTKGWSNSQLIFRLATCNHTNFPALKKAPNRGVPLRVHTNSRQFLSSNKFNVCSGVGSLFFVCERSACGPKSFFVNVRFSAKCYVFFVPEGVFTVLAGNFPDPPTLHLQLKNFIAPSQSVWTPSTIENFDHPLPRNWQKISARAPRARNTIVFTRASKQAYFLPACANTCLFFARAKSEFFLVP